MAYEVNSSGRADPVSGTEVPDDDPKVPDHPKLPDDPNVMAPGGLISLEDITLPRFPDEDWREPWATGAHPEWTDDKWTDDER